MDYGPRFRIQNQGTGTEVLSVDTGYEKKTHTQKVRAAGSSAGVTGSDQ